MSATLHFQPEEKPSWFGPGVWAIEIDRQRGPVLILGMVPDVPRRALIAALGADGWRIEGRSVDALKPYIAKPSNTGINLGNPAKTAPFQVTAGGIGGAAPDAPAMYPNYALHTGSGSTETWSHPDSAAAAQTRWEQGSAVKISTKDNPLVPEGYVLTEIKPIRLVPRLDTGADTGSTSTPNASEPAPGGNNGPNRATPTQEPKAPQKPPHTTNHKTPTHHTHPKQNQSKTDSDQKKRGYISRFLTRDDVKDQLDQ